MSDFKFEYELNPISRANAALDIEGQRIVEELEKARQSFRALSRRMITGLAFVSALLILLAASRLLSVFEIVAYIFLLTAVSLVPFRGGVARLIRYRRDALRAKKQLDDWNAVRQELSSTSSEDSARRLVPKAVN